MLSCVNPNRFIIIFLQFVLVTIYSYFSLMFILLLYLDFFTTFNSCHFIHIGPHGITIDKEDRVMYWAEEGRRSIWRANLDGTNRTRIIYTDLKEPGDMQLDPVEK